MAKWWKKKSNWAAITSILSVAGAPWVVWSAGESSWQAAAVLSVVSALGAAQTWLSESPSQKTPKAPPQAPA